MNFEIGDRVTGMGGGYALHATHACVPHNLCAKIPDNVRDEDAAANHLVATALHAVQTRTYPHWRERRRRRTGYRWSVCHAR